MQRKTEKKTAIVANPKRQRSFRLDDRDMAKLVRIAKKGRLTQVDALRKLIREA